MVEETGKEGRIDENSGALEWMGEWVRRDEAYGG